MRAWLEIDLGSVAHNFREVRRHLGGQSEMCVVVKADAYGHGIEPIVTVLDREGADSYAVISLDEALRVREVSKRDVLIMGYLDDAEIAESIRQGFVLSLFDRELADVCQSIAARVGHPARVQLKVETGLNRLGMEFDEAMEVLTDRTRFSELKPEAVFTHLSSSINREQDLVQLEKFQQMVAKMDSAGVRLPLHMANSHALGVFPEGYFDVVRIGLAVYGVEPVLPNLRPSLEAKTVVIQRKTLRAGEGTSYNHLFRAPQDMEIAIIAMGYAEGLSQGMTGKADALVRGRRVPIIGQICMNLSVIDTLGMPLERGDEVVVVGRQGAEEIRVTEMAKACGIRHHEIIQRLGKSLPKVYIDDVEPEAPTVAAPGSRTSE